jgi:hypothetical protein
MVELNAHGHGRWCTPRAVGVELGAVEEAQGRPSLAEPARVRRCGVTRRRRRVGKRERVRVRGGSNSCGWLHKS